MSERRVTHLKTSCYCFSENNNMVNYNNGKIYKVINTQNNVQYIGSTCRTLAQRMASHRASARGLNLTGEFYQAMRAVGIHEFTIHLIKNYPCKTKKELESEEYRLMQRCVEKGKILYNDTLDGIRTEKTCLKLSKALMGHTLSAEGRRKLSLNNGMRGKFGKLNHSFRRGSVYLSSANKLPKVIFQWHVSGIKKQKSFSVTKYGEVEAYRMAKEAQDNVYPIIDE